MSKIPKTLVLGHCLAGSKRIRPQICSKTSCWFCSVGGVVVVRSCCCSSQTIAAYYLLVSLSSLFVVEEKKIFGGEAIR